MGEQNVSTLKDEAQRKKFMRAILNDVQALEYMLDNDWFEKGITRVGAEQEMCLVHNKSFKPAPLAMEALEKLKEYPWVETELAKFNLEINLDPRTLSGTCFTDMENEVLHKLRTISDNITDLDINIILTGILPTLRKFDLGLHNLTPKVRYKSMIEAFQSLLIGDSFELRLVGIDELLVKHDSPLLEAVNTSFQVHLQVAPEDFVKTYNISQALTAPAMAIAANSPIVFGRRLWHETRIAMFQQSLDTRSLHEHLRERSPRVQFGKSWLEDSILEIYKEDISRFRVLLAGNVEEDSLALIKEGKVPKLRALQIHNSTVYRWNRPCYGISDNGKPHLRIENRVLPAGPSVLDEVANAVFWLGSVLAYCDEVDDIRDHMSFDDARDNFGKAARFGLDSKFTWFNDEKIAAKDLAREHIIPKARKALLKRNIAEDSINRYLSVIEKRIDKHMNGARWQLRAFSKMKEDATIDEALCALSCNIIENQKDNTPVHEWPEASISSLKEYELTKLKVSEFMSTDLFTVRPDDLASFVAEMMNWKNIRFVPVEDTKGKLVGLVAMKDMMKQILKEDQATYLNKSVADIMQKDPKIIKPESSIMEAIEMMQTEKLGCLPVVKNGDLIGLITDMDFVRISTRLMNRLESMG